MPNARRSHRESFRYVFGFILSAVVALVVIAFVFSLQAALEYGEHRGQIEFLEELEELRTVLRNRGDEILAGDATVQDLDELPEVGPISAQHVVAAILTPHDHAILRFQADGRMAVLHKGVRDPETIRFLTDPTTDLARFSPNEDWEEVRTLDGVSLVQGSEARVSLLTANDRRRYIFDVILNRLWPSILVGLVLAVGISILAFRFVYRRYGEVADERARVSDFARAATDFFWEMDADLRFSYFSERFTEVTGVPQAELLGKTREETGNPGASEAAWQGHLDALHGHRPFKNFVHPRSRPDGSVVWLSISGSPVFRNGAFQGFRGSGTDITRQRTIEAQLRETKENAERANRAKSDFLAAMSHDLRTPLNAIIGFAEVVRDEHFGPIDKRYRDYVGHIHTSGEMLLALVNEVLDLSAIEAGRRKFDLESLDVATMLQECETVLGPIAADAGIDFHLDAPSWPVRCYADETALRQVLQNLVSNSIKFTPHGGQVTLSAKAGADESVVFQVRDTGRGMEESEIARVQEPFEKGGARSYVTAEGWGLGLSIVRNLVLAMDGTFTIESVIRRGTTVTVTLPKVPAARAVESETA